MQLLWRSKRGGSIMNITFKYTEREFRLAMNQSHGDSKRIVIDLIIAIVLFAFGLYLFTSKSYEFYSGFIIAISLLLLFVIIARNYIVPKLIFTREPKYKEEYELSFLEEEITFTAGNMKSILPWNHYIGMKETNDFIFLLYGKKRYTIIPKRVFQGQEEMKRFIDLVMSKINK
jgi:hypothetical protein